MPITDSISAALRSIPLPQSLARHNRAVVLGTAAVLGTALIIPRAYRDYLTFISYDSGAVPSNFLGWLYVRTLMQPLGREMLSTAVYERRMAAAEGHGKGDEGFLDGATLEAREGGQRPVLGQHVIPQRQLTQLPDEQVMQKLMATFNAFGNRNHHLVKFGSSNLELHTHALFVADHIPASTVAGQMRREVSHVHSGSEHSLHVVLSPADCIRVIEAGWGQRHPFSGSTMVSAVTLGKLVDLPPEYILIYAPRNDAEVQTVMQIVAASVKFMTGREDVR